MIDLQALVTEKESTGLAAKDAIIASQAATIAGFPAQVAKLNAAIDHCGILGDSSNPFDWVSAPAVGPNLTGYVQTFYDDFSVDSIMTAAGSPAGGKWYSPARANFTSPSYASFDRNQVTVANGMCRIRIERISPPSATSAWGTWRAGHIQTMNPQGVGFSQLAKNAYFEARMKFPEQLQPYGYEAYTGLPMNPQRAADSHGARGSWPSFWLLSDNEYAPFYNTNFLIEMDAMECYGSDPSVHSSVHLKPRRVPLSRDPSGRQTNSQSTPKNWTQWDGNWHTYGALYDDDFLTIYFDNVAITRYEMNRFLQIPMYLNISHALWAETGQGPWPCKDPMDLYIDYVKVLAKP